MVDSEATRQRLLTDGRLDCRVMSGSMEPLLPVGTLITVEPIDFTRDKPVRIFDIVVFWNGEKFVCHFVLHINQVFDRAGEPVYITRNLMGGEDLPLTRSQVLGIVTSHRLSWRQRLSVVLQRLRRRYGRGLF